MSRNSKIEWCDDTWNPVTGCTKVSEGCRNCYALKFAERWRGTPGHYFENGFDITLRPDKLEQPLKWKRPRKIFVNSMSDLFHDSIDEKYIAKVFAIMWLAQQHTFQVLTKRPERMARLLNDEDFAFHIGWFASQAIREFGLNRETCKNLPEWPVPNIWFGVSVEHQKAADERIPLLLQTPAAVRFLSCEPLLGPVDLSNYIGMPMPITDEWGNLIGVDSVRLLDWIVAGGESGTGARPMHPDWARSLRYQCQAAGVAYFHKQNGEWLDFQEATNPGRVPVSTLRGNMHTFEDGVEMIRVGKSHAGRLLDGREWNEFPEVSR